MIVTIDGPSGTGKSTTAKGLAQKLGFTYFDTGAMYRSVAYLAIQKKATSVEEVEALLDHFSFRIELQNGHKRYFVDDKEVTEAIRSIEVTNRVSEVAAIPAVRQKLVAIQREVGEAGDAVFEGRDLGTVVFPHAQVKIFLTARPEARAKRRHQELMSEKGLDVSEKEILADIEARDRADSTRKHSPLRPAEDALLFDTSDLTLEEVIDQLAQYVRRSVSQ